MDLSATQVNQLVSQHGTPLLVICTQQLEKNYKSLARALPGVTLFYAVKSNPHPHRVTDTGLRYYNADVHRGSFALPNFVQELVKTRGNPGV